MKGVGQNAPDPGLEFSRVAQLAQLGPGLGHRLRNQVFRILAVARQPQRDSIEPIREARDLFGEEALLICSRSPFHDASNQTGFSYDARGPDSVPSNDIHKPRKILAPCRE